MTAAGWRRDFSSDAPAEGVLVPVRGPARQPGRQHGRGVPGLLPGLTRAVAGADRGRPDGPGRGRGGEPAGRRRPGRPRGLPVHAGVRHARFGRVPGAARRHRRLRGAGGRRRAARRGGRSVPSGVGGGDRRRRSPGAARAGVRPDLLGDQPRLPARGRDGGPARRARLLAAVHPRRRNLRGVRAPRSARRPPRRRRAARGRLVPDGDGCGLVPSGGGGRGTGRR